MSLESWKAEYILTATDPVSACDASAKKWEGLLAVNLDRHDVHFGGIGRYIRLCDRNRSIEDIMNAKTCALCHLTHNDGVRDWPAMMCSICPLGKIDRCGGLDSTWRRVVNNPTDENIQAMIDKIKEAKEREIGDL